jgi:hypothetical protein
MSLKEGDVEFVVYAAKGRVVAIATSRSMIGSREPIALAEPNTKANGVTMHFHSPHHRGLLGWRDASDSRDHLEMAWGGRSGQIPNVRGQCGGRESAHDVRPTAIVLADDLR